MKYQAVLTLFFLFVLAFQNFMLVQSWSCPYQYNCGKRQVTDDETGRLNSRLANRLNSLRNFRTMAVERLIARKQKRGLDNTGILRAHGNDQE
ncbi:unnamed protein product [Pocillopora meandrina]|uniref:Uncharacterized protein n=1 Tax=Pocillopora meandrina TaxID=46732 RepID=A0AAU9X3C3_9CNID|nr:unnamed protein product [Pocillopora meandrina]